MQQRTFHYTAFLIVLTLLCAGAAQAATRSNSGDTPAKRGLPMQPPRVLVQKMFPQDPLFQSLSGGWGYEQTDPVIITTPQELAGQFFDTEPLEFALVDFCNYEEFSGAQAEANKKIAMGFEVQSQRIVRENGKVLEEISGTVQVISTADFTKLSKDVEGIDPRDAEARKSLDSRVSKVARTYWFDLTEPFLHNAELEKQGLKPPKEIRR